ncbi:MAG: hypothetical protein GY810_01495 [Aureispira sp.]|nr:hypothetical protein [Aureispira sp.]
MGEVAPWFFLIYGFFIFSLFNLVKRAENKYITVIVNLFIVVIYSAIFAYNITTAPVSGENWGAGLAVFVMVAYLAGLVILHSIINLITAYVLASKNKNET